MGDQMSVGRAQVEDEDSPQRSEQQRSDAKPSKSARKRQAARAKMLGAELAALKPPQRAGIPMSAGLVEAIDEYQRTKPFEARRRQLQFIGRLMRGEDQDAIADGIARATRLTAKEKSLNRKIEGWRDRLIDDRGALTEYVATHPSADVRALRDAIRQVRRCADPDARPRFARSLFRLLRDYEALGDPDSRKTPS